MKKLAWAKLKLGLARRATRSSETIKGLKTSLLPRFSEVARINFHVFYMKTATSVLHLAIFESHSFSHSTCDPKMGTPEIDWNHINTIFQWGSLLSQILRRLVGVSKLWFVRCKQGSGGGSLPRKIHSTSYGATQEGKQARHLQRL